MIDIQTPDKQFNLLSYLSLHNFLNELICKNNIRKILVSTDALIGGKNWYAIFFRQPQSILDMQAAVFLLDFQLSFRI